MTGKILVIDDNEPILHAIQTALLFEGYTVEVTTSGKKGLEIAHKWKPNLILMDIRLSGEDGREIAKILKKNVDTQRIPILFVAAHAKTSTYATEAGIEGYIHKPFELAVLFEKIAQYIRKE